MSQQLRAITLLKDLSLNRVVVHNACNYCSRGNPTPLVSMHLHSFTYAHLHTIQNNKIFKNYLKICRLPKEKHTYQPSHKTFDLQSVLPAKYAKTMVVQNSWE